MITRLKLSTIEQGLPKYRSMLAGNDAFSPYAFESIATATGTGSSATVTFNSIPSTYQHLQIRFLAKTTDSVVGASDTYELRVTFNGVTTNYAAHRLYGDYSAAGATAGTALASVLTIRAIPSSNATNGSNIYGVGIIDIHDYASTTKNKVMRMINGTNANTAGNASYRINLVSGLSLDTNAITSISISTSGTAFTTGSTFALYGVKGA
jgi:hypothetical protein